MLLCKINAILTSSDTIRMTIEFTRNILANLLESDEEIII